MLHALFSSVQAAYRGGRSAAATQAVDTSARAFRVPLPFAAVTVRVAFIPSRCSQREVFDVSVTRNDHSSSRAFWARSSRPTGPSGPTPEIGPTTRKVRRCWVGSSFPTDVFPSRSRTSIASGSNPKASAARAAASRTTEICSSASILDASQSWVVVPHPANRNVPRHKRRPIASRFAALFRSFIPATRLRTAPCPPRSAPDSRGSFRRSTRCGLRRSSQKSWPQSPHQQGPRRERGAT